jgi:N-acetylmuramoyl-L-alanine amidase
MSRAFAFLAAVLCVFSTTAMAQEFSALARVDADQSSITDLGRDAVQLDLALSQGVPYRLFTLSEPSRLVVDFKEVDWSGLSAEKMVQTDRIGIVRFGTYRPGWSRLVAELITPMGITSAGLQVDDTTSAAHVTIRLDPTNDEDFAAIAGAPNDPRWDLPEPETFATRPERGPDDPVIVVLDPGHGGIDPGAEQGRINEKSLMLTFARELREALVRSGEFEVTLTRNEDHFVSLERRIAIAHQAGADVFLSLHADSLAEGQAHGATVHVLSRDASDVASAKLAERHNRDDLLAGADLSATDDVVTDVLLDLARQETWPRTKSLALALVDGMAQTGGPMNRRPLRAAAFSVLKAADIPSVLIEIGFLSSPRDLKNLQDRAWRAGMAEGIRSGLQAWRRSDAASRALVRQ